MTQVNLKIRSKCLETKAQVCILLPEPDREDYTGEVYSTGKKHRVLWLLHGATCDGDNFLIDDRIQDMMRGSGTIVVIPSAMNSDYANHGEFAGGYRFTDFFFTELMPFVYSTFPASSLREDNYVAGYSMGGSGAVMLGLYRPGKFAGIGAMGCSLRKSDFLEPYLDMSGWEFRTFAVNNRRALPTEFGRPEDGITLKEINMISRYPTVRDYVNSEELTWNRFREVHEAGNLPDMYFCCGDRDGCCEDVLRFINYAEDIGAGAIPYDLIHGRGHDCEKEAVKKMLEHFAL